jgi:hypothetical protein
MPAAWANITPTKCGVAPAARDEVGERLHALGDHRPDAEGEVTSRDGRHRREVLHRVVAELPVDVGIDEEQRAGRKERHRAVGVVGSGIGQCDAPGCACPVVDQDGRRVDAAQLVGHHARQHVGGPACWKADDDARGLLNQLRECLAGAGNGGQRGDNCVGKDLAAIQHDAVSCLQI